MKTIFEKSVCEYKIKKSTFICHLFPVVDQKEVKSIISELSKEHKNANHNCWAYVLNKNGNIFHSSDNGEPSGTAGKPMLNALQSAELTNVLAVVTRYFGGVKLGIRGLIDAYGGCVAESIENCNVKELIDYFAFIINTDYSFAEIFKYQMGKFEIKIDDIEYSDSVSFTLSVSEFQKEDFINYVKPLEASNKLSFLEV